jgi:HD superfamily phosphohydrolase
MKTHKIFNDPVYGFVQVPYGLLFTLVEHPYFQRLRRIKQLSLTHYVYPGALHTRFHHALGALHLMTLTLQVLREKGIDISDEEFEAAQAAILLHDIGHGPYSHTLEHTLIQVHHEELSLLFMQKLNEELDGQLSLAIQIFQGTYHKPYLHQLVSSQLDMDRMDYLNRDSYFTGVSEGVIGYHRLVKMLTVHEGELVVEEKGLYSVERFLTARRLMYWQVYLHKTVLSAELMLIKTLERAKELTEQGVQLPAPSVLSYFLNNRDLTVEDFHTRRDEMLAVFARLDDTDIAAAVKEWQFADDTILSYLSGGLANRRLFKLEFKNKPFGIKHRKRVLKHLREMNDLPDAPEDYFLLEGSETNTAYTASQNEIRMLLNTGKVRSVSKLMESDVNPSRFTKYYLCYPK